VGEVVNGTFNEGWNGTTMWLQLAVSPAAKAVEEATNDRHDGLCGHWLFVNLGQEIELGEGDFAFLVVQLVGSLQIGEFVFRYHLFVLFGPGGDCVRGLSHGVFSLLACELAVCGRM